MTQAPERRRSTPRRVGIFGGSFDPPHKGHVSAARDVADALSLDEVLWIPARRSPHKPDEPLTPARLRVEMVSAAAALDDRFTLSECEVRRPGPSFTIDTLRALGGAGGSLQADELFLIIGADQFRGFDAWHEPDRVRALATLVVMDREGEGVDPGDAERVPVRRVDVSSTEVRSLVSQGRDVAGLVPEAVADIIAREALYAE